jgi:casein kinase I family protein HRR25
MSADLSNYEIIKKIGTGAFGVVYKAKDKLTGELVAIKVEEIKNTSRLDYEYRLYKEIDDNVGFPEIIDFRKTKKNYICVMECLGPSLEDLFDFCDKRFSLKTTLMIGIQILNRIESIHNIGIIHRDIKPDNFLIGLGKNKSRIYLIDFGLSKRYIIDGNHLEYSTDKSFTGSFRYSSIRNHRGIEQSRRDDLESIGYMLIFFLKGSLPWQGLDGSTKEKRSNNIFKVKYDTSLADLCDGIPREFLLYMKYCRLLKFKQKPDYDLLRNLFICLFKKNNYQLDYIYDWNIVAKNKKSIPNKEN